MQDIPPLTYESDPELYRVIESIGRSADDMAPILSGLSPRARPKYYGRRPANTLYRRRVERHLSQQELARLTGTTRRTISAIESRRREPSVYLAIAIAEALQATVQDIFRLEPLLPVAPSQY